VPAASTWTAFLALFGDCFTAPGRRLFEHLITAWVLCPGRHTLTRLWSVIDPLQRRPYGAYARLVREGKWSLTSLWRRLACHLVERWAPTGRLVVLLDDTLMHKTGRKVAGAGWFRDAVRSTGNRLVVALGLNVVVLALRVVPPWGGEPLALPIMVALHCKNGRSLIEIGADLVRLLADWLPERTFLVVCDGAYASLLGEQLPRTTVVTRIRRNAALYAPPQPRRPGQRGRPRKKGARLPTPPELAARATDWRRQQVRIRGQLVERDLWFQDLLWYETCGERVVRLVVVRDPEGKQADDYLVCGDLSLTPGEVATAYGDRWPIEDSFRNLKQYLGAQDPQSWVGSGPIRAVALACFTYSAVWDWFLAEHARLETATDLNLEQPWYSQKRTPSFADALASLRHELWSARIFGTSGRDSISPKNARALLRVLALAA
jgi:hypothetical protein